MELKPKIIFEDDYIVAIDKPAGLVVNRSNTHVVPTLQDFVEDQVAIEEELEETDYTSRSGILHRLDKDTSGVILMAKDTNTFEAILKQFKNRELSKEYKAILIGDIHDSIIEIDAPIKRNPKFTFKFAVGTDGKPSQTRIELVKNFQLNGRNYTSVTVRPKTGRTHQIRVHCLALNHCVAGDEIYCTRKEFVDSYADFARLMLHAHSIEITHPVTGGKLLLKSELPEEFTPYF